MVGNDSDSLAAVVRNLRPEEKAFRDAWVAEYVRNWDPYQATVRAGMTGDRNIKAFIKASKGDRYIQLLLVEHQERTRSDGDTNSIKNQMEGVLISIAANPYAQSAARVQAAKAVMDMHGLNAPKKTDVNVNLGGRVMLIPGIATLDDWEAAAAKSQDKLVADARADLN